MYELVSEMRAWLVRHFQNFVLCDCQSLLFYMKEKIIILEHEYVKNDRM